MNEQVSSWLTAIDGLPEIHERLKTVVILNDDALQVIKSQDGDKTLFYCDPPYLHETRHGKGLNAEYTHEMTPVDHARLLMLLASPRHPCGIDHATFTDEEHDELVALFKHKLSGKFVLSGYHSEMYDLVAESQGWRCVEIEIDNKASGKKTKDRKIECLWMNYPKHGNNKGEMK